MEKTKKPRQKKTAEPIKPEVIVKAESLEVIPVSPEAIPEQSKKRVSKVKKPIQVVAVVTPDGIEGTFTPEPRRPLIVHLPFQSTEVNLEGAMYTMKYDPTPPPQPMPYDSGAAYFQVNSENSSSELEVGVEQEGWKMPIDKSKVTTEEVIQKKEEVKIEEIPVKKIATETKSKLMIQYQTKPGEVLSIPAKTDISCFWTTYEFEGNPYFIPIREDCGVYTVYGNFSSPQCALAYLLQEHLDSHVRWERMSLLHRMYRIRGRIYPAPPRESLKKFGGPYTIEEYNTILHDEKVRIDIHQPPLISILGTLDTKPIDFYDSSIQNTFTGGFSMDRFKSWSEQGGALRLKRSKPLKDKESTLDSCIQISIKRG
jgi:hypothetical protein